MSPFEVGVDSMLEIMHIHVASHLFWFKRENLEQPSLLRVWQAPPVAVLEPGAAGSYLPRQHAAALSRCCLLQAAGAKS